MNSIRSDAVAALILYSQCTACYVANVKGSPITLARNPGLPMPSPDEENEPAQPPQMPEAAAGPAGARLPAAAASAAVPRTLLMHSETAFRVGR